MSYISSFDDWLKWKLSFVEAKFKGFKIVFASSLSFKIPDIFDLKV